MTLNSPRRRLAPALLILVLAAAFAGIGTASAAPKGQGDGTGDSDGYTAVDLHLRVATAGPDWPKPQCNGDFGIGDGRCTGTFVGGKDPFGDGVSGTVEWASRYGGGVESQLEDAGLKTRIHGLIIVIGIASGRDRGSEILCVLPGRASGDCTTASGQTAGAGTRGGPLKLDAHAGPKICVGTPCEVYVEVSGFCPKDGLCSV
jgi:hypothetical protein